MPKQFVPVARVEDVPLGEVRVFDTEYQRLVVCNVDGTFYAIEDVCTHDGGPLGEGILEGVAIECPRHGAQFDVRTGEVLLPPAVVSIQNYPVRVENGMVLVELETE